MTKQDVLDDLEEKKLVFHITLMNKFYLDTISDLPIFSC